jgi:succinate-acetate transporter protein
LFLQTPLRVSQAVAAVFVALLLTFAPLTVGASPARAGVINATWKRTVLPVGVR